MQFDVWFSMLCLLMCAGTAGRRIKFKKGSSAILPQDKQALVALLDLLNDDDLVLLRDNEDETRYEENAHSKSQAVFFSDELKDMKMDPLARYSNMESGIGRGDKLKAAYAAATESLFKHRSKSAHKKQAVSLPELSLASVFDPRTVMEILNKYGFVHPWDKQTNSHHHVESGTHASRIPFQMIGPGFSKGGDQHVDLQGAVGFHIIIVDDHSNNNKLNPNKKNSSNNEMWIFMMNPYYQQNGGAPSATNQKNDLFDMHIHMMNKSWANNTKPMISNKAFMYSNGTHRFVINIPVIEVALYIKGSGHHLNDIKVSGYGMTGNKTDKTGPRLYVLTEGKASTKLQVYNLNKSGVTGNVSKPVDKNAKKKPKVKPASGPPQPATPPSGGANDTNGNKSQPSPDAGGASVGDKGAGKGPGDKGGSEGGKSSPGSEGGKSGPGSEGGKSGPGSEGGKSGPGSEGGKSSPDSEGGKSAPGSEGGKSAPGSGGKGAPDSGGKGKGGGGSDTGGGSGNGGGASGDRPGGGVYKIDSHSQPLANRYPFANSDIEVTLANKTMPLRDLTIRQRIRNLLRQLKYTLFRGYNYPAGLQNGPNGTAPRFPDVNVADYMNSTSKGQKMLFLVFNVLAPGRVTLNGTKMKCKPLSDTLQPNTKLKFADLNGHKVHIDASALNKSGEACEPSIQEVLSQPKAEEKEAKEDSNSSGDDTSGIIFDNE